MILCNVVACIETHLIISLLNIHLEHVLKAMRLFTKKKKGILAVQKGETCVWE